MVNHAFLAAKLPVNVTQVVKSAGVHNWPPEALWWHWFTFSMGPWSWRLWRVKLLFSSSFPLSNMELPSWMNPTPPAFTWRWASSWRITKHSWQHEAICNIFPCCSSSQSQFKSQGSTLVPDSGAEQALMYQRMFEGLTFYDKLSKTAKSLCL